ncbi:hypothetical protein K1W69_01915 [Hoeflea sp. WL0058]|uniref:Uncharacterized protein n=1 Tax=Flavimaribacter sediminis TaxID=2865987 RepID=A0AAE2ZK03_9HYPH|nr:hypothetical protein [Flavimaribacter sediminis]MBW8635925.1 hypothetical protein [Flavimaribacter sediminis]
MIRILLSMMAVLAISMAPARAQLIDDEAYHLLITEQKKIPSVHVKILNRAFDAAESKGIPLDNYNAYIGFYPIEPGQIVVSFYADDVKLNPYVLHPKSEKFAGFDVMFDRDLEVAHFYWHR